MGESDDRHGEEVAAPPARKQSADVRSERLTKVLPRSSATDALADLASCWADLARAAALTRSVRALKRSGESTAVLTGLTEAAIMSYGRCFAGGRRRQLDENMVPAGSLPTHRVVMSLRHRFTAHSVNEMNQAVVVANTDDWPSMTAVRALVYRSELPPSLAYDIETLIVILRDELACRIDAARIAVHSEASARSVSSLVALADVKVNPSRPSGFAFNTIRKPGQSTGTFKVPFAVGPDAGPAGTITNV